MDVQTTDLDGVLIVVPKVFADERGCFLETWHEARYGRAGLPTAMVQDNFSQSKHAVLRGLHYQEPRPQAKLVQAIEGEIFDVAVDIRVGSPTFARWVGVVLTGHNRRQLYIPEGFAHGFCVLSREALVSYKCTELYYPECDAGIAWNDPDLAIDWPIPQPILSAKDQRHPTLHCVSVERLPRWREAMSLSTLPRPRFSPTISPSRDAA